MTYWAREHEHNLRRIGDITRELDYIYEDMIPGLSRDLRDDDHAATADSRARLAEARKAIGQAMGAIEQAREQLPAPRFAPMLHPTAEDVMTREG